MKKFYISMIEYVHIHPKLKKTILIINQYFPVFIFVLYPCILAFLYFTKNTYFYASLYKPLGTFLSVSLLRKAIQRPRPYETLSLSSIVEHKKGESFPSRHSASAMIIALVSFYINPFVGIVALIIAFCICLGRVLAGVHYLSDVISGILIACLIFFL